MIELPEALIIARQMSKELKGKRIESGIRGNVPYKFAFYNCSAEEDEAILRGKMMGEATGHGNAILASVGPDYTLLAEMLDYAEVTFTDKEKNTLRIRIYEHDGAFQALAQRRGYRKEAEHPEYDSVFVSLRSRA